MDRVSTPQTRHPDDESHHSEHESEWRFGVAHDVIRADNSDDGLAAKRLATPRQHSLARRISASGVGIHNGKAATLTLHPAEADHGIVFRRLDLIQAGRAAEECLIPALYNYVGNTHHCSEVQNSHGVALATIEHLMAALAALKIDNALIDVTGPEMPILDGSASDFVALLEKAGRVAQKAPRRSLKILRPVRVENRGRIAELSPFAANEESTDANAVLRLDFAIDFSQPIGQQNFRFDLGRDDFAKNIASARTFCFTDEIALMKQNGLGLGGSLDNCLVIKRDNGSAKQAGSEDAHILNPEGLRYEDECVRHKILDAIGDLYLAGAPIIGHYRAERGGHEMTNLLLRAVFNDPANYAWV